MTMRQLHAFRWLFVWIAASFGYAIGGDNPNRAEVRHMVATAQPSEYPEVAAFTLQFDLLLTNNSDKPISIPGALASGKDTTRSAVISVESKLPDGRWKTEIQSSVYGSGKETFERCSSLPPGASAEVSALKDGLVLLKRRLAELGGEPTMRFAIWTFCKGLDGSVKIEAARTQPFVLKLAVN